MEKIEIKPMEQETKTIYKSVDGLEFNDANKCEEYEDALARVIYERYEREYVKVIAPEYNIFCDIAGSEEYEMHVVEVKTQRAVDDIMTLRKIYASRHNVSKNIDSDYACLKNAMQEGTTILIGRGYSGCGDKRYALCGMDNFYIYGTCKSIVNTLRKNFCLE